MATVIDKGNPLVPADQKFNSDTRTAADVVSVMLLTPAFAGELVRALDTGQHYRGLSLVAGSWGLVSVDV